MADLPKSYYKMGEELTSDEVTQLLDFKVSAYDMYLVRNNLHTFRTQTDNSFKQIFTCLEGIKDSLEVEFTNGSVKKSKINDVILEHHNDIKEVKKGVLDLGNKKQDKGFFKTTVKSINWWADNLIKIILLIGVILGWIGLNNLQEVINDLPKG